MQPDKYTVAVIFLVGCVAAMFTESVFAGSRTVADALQKYGPEARSRILPYFEQSGVVYPPQKLTFLAIKNSARLEVWAGPSSNPTYIHTYYVKAFSGTSGPKLRQGDWQVPEGFYRIEALNPNSNYHLSMKLNYPNTFDLMHALLESRTKPGSNIFIHGKALSVGCLAMGDRAIEELFVLAADAGRNNVSVVIAPSDPRKQMLAAPDSPPWVADLYQQISTEFAKYMR